MAGVDTVLRILGELHRKLSVTLGAVPPDEVSGRSYCTDWSIAQVASHLGSGAVIGRRVIEAGLAGRPAPGLDDMRAVWAVWDALPPAEQPSRAVAADGDLLARIEGITWGDRARWRSEFEGRAVTLHEMLMERLAEVAVHLWDIAVPAASQEAIYPPAAAVLVDHLGETVARAARATDADPIDVRVETTGPSRTLTLRVAGRHTTLHPGAAGDHGGARLALPAEALIRLVYGRLDAEHTPATTAAQGVELDRLRALFPGM